MNEITFAIFVLGVIAIVAITHRQNDVAQKAISGITVLGQEITKRIPHTGCQPEKPKNQ